MPVLASVCNYWFAATCCALIVLLIRFAALSYHSLQFIASSQQSGPDACVRLSVFLQNERCFYVPSASVIVRAAERAAYRSEDQWIHAREPTSSDHGATYGRPVVNLRPGVLPVSSACCSLGVQWAAHGCSSVLSPDSHSIAQALEKQAVQCQQSADAPHAPHPFASASDSRVQQMHLPESQGDQDQEEMQRSQQTTSAWQLQRRPAAGQDLGFLSHTAESRYLHDTIVNTAPHHVKLFVAVVTLAANVRKRDAIRVTWGADARLQRVMFVAARPRDTAMMVSLRAEALRHRDLVVVSHVWEHYDNITHQTLEACREAASDPVATHLLKVDDDSFVRVGPLLRYLALTPTAWTFAGYMENPGGRPHRINTAADKWYVSKEEWPDDHYPPWAHGPGYTLTSDLVKEIASGAAAAASPNGMFKLEDIAMGSWVDHISRQKGIQANLLRSTRFNYIGCQCGDLISHYFTAAMTYCTFSETDCCCSPFKQNMYQAQLERVSYDAKQMVLSTVGSAAIKTPSSRTQYTSRYFEH